MRTRNITATVISKLRKLDIQRSQLVKEFSIMLENVAILMVHCNANFLSDQFYGKQCALAQHDGKIDGTFPSMKREGDALAAD